MTIGNRIAEIRKKHNLSQEAFGESLGVSRQSISKWESDINIPDVDKLILISKKYHVSIGWVLGVEQEKDLGHLSADEIIEKTMTVLQGENASKKPARNKILMGVVVVCLVAVLLQMGMKLKELGIAQQQTAQQLFWQQESVGNLENTLTEQIAGITDKVENALYRQNSLIANYEIEIENANLSENTVTIKMRVLPKSYENQMVFVGSITSNGTQYETLLEEVAGQWFEGSITVVLSDQLGIYVKADYSGKKENQYLESLENLYTESLSSFEGFALDKRVYQNDYSIIDITSNIEENYEISDSVYTIQPVCFLGNEVWVESAKMNIYLDDELVKTNPVNVSKDLCDEGYCYYTYDINGIDWKESDGKIIRLELEVVDNFGRVINLWSHSKKIVVHSRN